MMIKLKTSKHKRIHKRRFAECVWYKEYKELGEIRDEGLYRETDKGGISEA